MQHVPDRIADKARADPAIDESGYDLATSHPAVRHWLDRVAALPGWVTPYDLLPGKRLQRYA